MDTTSSFRLGRIRHLVMVANCLIVVILTGLILTFVPIQNTSILSLVSSIIYISITIYVLFLKTRRLNDFDFSAWWLALLLIPYVNVLWALAIFIIPGSKTANQYGSLPEKTKRKEVLYLGILSCILMFFSLVILLND